MLTKFIVFLVTNRWHTMDLTGNVSSMSLLSVHGMKVRVSSGGYSNLGTQGKDLPKSMLSKKEKEF